MKVWITKYALTQGIFELDAEIVDKRYASADSADGYRIFTREYAVSKGEALMIAETMRTKRIANLEKQIKRLQKLVFK